MKINRVKNKGLAQYTVSKDRIFHTIKRYCCIDGIIYYKIIRTDAYSKIEKCTTDQISPSEYKQGRHFFTLEGAFENIELFNTPEFNNTYSSLTNRKKK